jgi:hypothetical protein
LAAEQEARDGCHDHHSDCVMKGEQSGLLDTPREWAGATELFGSDLLGGH